MNTSAKQQIRDIITALYRNGTTDKLCDAIASHSEKPINKHLILKVIRAMERIDEIAMLNYKIMDCLMFMREVEMGNRAYPHHAVHAMDAIKLVARTVRKRVNAGKGMKKGIEILKKALGYDGQDLTDNEFSIALKLASLSKKDETTVVSNAEKLGVTRVTHIAQHTWGSFETTATGYRKPSLKGVSPKLLKLIQIVGEDMPG